MMVRYFSFPLVAAVVFSFATTTSAIDAGRSLYIEGYTGAISYAPGDELALHLSSTASECTLSISRVGRGGLRQCIEQRSLAGWSLKRELPLGRMWSNCVWASSLRNSSLLEASLPCPPARLGRFSGSMYILSCGWLCRLTRPPLAKKTSRYTNLMPLRVHLTSLPGLFPSLSDLCHDRGGA